MSISMLYFSEVIAYSLIEHIYTYAVFCGVTAYSLIEHVDVYAVFL